MRAFPSLSCLSNNSNQLMNRITRRLFHWHALLDDVPPYCWALVGIVACLQRLFCPCCRDTIEPALPGLVAVLTVRQRPAPSHCYPHSTEVRSKSELLKELQGLPVTNAVIYCNVDRKAWEQIAKEHQGVRYVVMVIR